MYSSHVSRVEAICREQDDWRNSCINLIASEQVMSRRARGVLGSDFAHRYAEGHPGERYYQGTDKIDTIETDAKRYLKTLFGCMHTEVRPISGTNANEAVFSRYIRPGDIVIANSTPAGGHISHDRAGTVGKYTRNILNFPVTEDGYHIDVARTRDLIHLTKPALVIFGKSLFLFPEPVKDLIDVCLEVKAKVVYDGAHVLGLIAGKQFQDPLAEGAHLISASTHKTFPGPQRGLILSNMGVEDWRRIDKGAFPGSSSNHHLDTLPPLLITTFEMLAYGQEYAAQVVRNAQALAKSLDEKGMEVQGKESGYTRSHQVAVDVSKSGGGAAASSLLKDNNIILNMNLLPSEPLSHHDNPSGVRIGVQEMTRFGMKEAEMERIAELIADCILETKSVQEDVIKFRSGFQKVHYSFDDSPADC
jgi:glycine hydroxymethyltransferase